MLGKQKVQFEENELIVQVEDNKLSLLSLWDSDTTDLKLTKYHYSEFANKGVFFILQRNRDHAPNKTHKKLLASGVHFYVILTKQQMKAKIDEGKPLVDSNTIINVMVSLSNIFEMPYDREKLL